MKQYVLDEPMTAAPPPPAESQGLALMQPGWWRWFLLALLLEPVALALLYLALNGTPGASPAAPSQGVAYVASFSFPRQADAARAPANAQAVAAPVSRVQQQRGRYLVELHDEAPAAALAMLAQATKARVAGSDVLIASPLRLTRSLVAASPREAWQAVFGDVANFAIACAGSACEVRFVSLLKPATPEALQGDFSLAAPALAPAAQASVDQATAAAPLLNGDGVPIDN
jgi:hypothetical protein